MRTLSWEFKRPVRSLARVFIGSVVFLAGCSAWMPVPTAQSDLNTGGLPTQRITATPFQPLRATGPSTPVSGPSATFTPLPSPTASQTPTPVPGIWAAEYIPEGLRTRLALPAGIGWMESGDHPLLQLEVDEEHLIGNWVYALVAPFPTLVDGVTEKDVLRSWRGEAQGPFGGQPILMDENTAGVFSAWLGEPAPGAVQVMEADQLLDYAWEHRPAWALVAFESLEPRWKALEVDGISPLHKDFDAGAYALTVPFSVAGDPAQVEAFLALNQSAGEGDTGITNREADQLTTVAMTGVTALVRATAFTMERNGITYPAEDIGSLLRGADITHISNEIPFDPSCPPPNPSQADLRFCSDPDYIALMEAVGTDVVELTGDHFADRGPEAMRYTLDLYNEGGWTYYGGGYDRKDARAARVIEHNGNKIAFIGCNGKGGGYATASESQPGAVACDFDWMHQEIRRLREEGDLVIATFQHFEYYSYYPQPLQIQDFGGMAEAGASVVSGSQAHQPQGMAFDGPAFIHYGLGNLFFDQYQFCTDNACDDGFIDRHVFYDGRYIGTELIPIRFVDFAKPRLMTPEERSVLLDKVFTASGW